MYYDDMYEDDDGFLIDDDGYVNVWIDGSCLGNGRRNARAGYGVFFNYNHFMWILHFIRCFNVVVVVVVFDIYVRLIRNIFYSFD